jgi:hypothetical protein
LGAVATGYLGGHLSFARSVGTGERGASPAPSPATPTAAGEPTRDGARPSDAADTVDLRGAATLLEMPEQQVHDLIAQGLLTPVGDGGTPRFRESEVRAVRLLGG